MNEENPKEIQENIATAIVLLTALLLIICFATNTTHFLWDLITPAKEVVMHIVSYKGEGRYLIHALAAFMGLFLGVWVLQLLNDFRHGFKRLFSNFFDNNEIT